MSEDRHKPRRQADPPGSDTGTRRLHESIQEARDATRQAQAAAADARAVTRELAALSGRLSRETSEETLRERLDPVITRIASRLLELLDETVEVFKDREQQLEDHIAKILGTSDKAELVELIAGKVTLDVAAAAKRINEGCRQETEAIQSLVALLPEGGALARTLGIEVHTHGSGKPCTPQCLGYQETPTSVPPSARRRNGAHQRRR